MKKEDIRHGQSPERIIELIKEFTAEVPTMSFDEIVIQSVTMLGLIKTRDKSSPISKELDKEFTDVSNECFAACHKRIDELGYPPRQHGEGVLARNKPEWRH